ncbi:MAG: hypothetical protein HY737_01180 [Candidatus Omnitrophica bacterium]|nr:hypothetical protein [Candidatus Omnitrophota bacterium]
MRPLILSLVERGWRDARMRALELPQDMVVVHLVKGRLPRSVRALIGGTHPVRMIGTPRMAFWPLAWAWCVGAWMTGRLQAVWVDHPRSYERLARLAHRFGVEIVLITHDAYRAVV